MFNQYIMEVSAEDLIERIFQKLPKFTDKEFEKMNDYCKSIGFKLKIDRYDLSDANVINFDLLDYRKQNFNPDTPIKEFKLPIKCTDDIFVILDQIIDQYNDHHTYLNIIQCEHIYTQ